MSSASYTRTFILHKSQILFSMFFSSVFDISPKRMCCLSFGFSLFLPERRFLLYLSSPETKQPLPRENLTATLPPKDKAMVGEKVLL
jgi:hypothetical protein